MKTEIRRETVEVGVMVTLWTASTEAHSLATDERAALEAAVGKFADWMTTEFRRLRAAREAHRATDLRVRTPVEVRVLPEPAGDPLADFMPEAGR